MEADNLTSVGALVLSAINEDPPFQGQLQLQYNQAQFYRSKIMTYV